jgi:hypothetical protein
MRWWLVIPIALAACGDPELEQLTKVRQTVCACETAACAEAALETVPKGKIESNHRSQRVARDMLDCLAKLYDGQRPITDPDAPVEPPDEPTVEPSAAARRP